MNRPASTDDEPSIAGSEQLDRSDSDSGSSNGDAHSSDGDVRDIDGDANGTAPSSRWVISTLTTHVAQTLFRGNTALTKTAELLMGWYGKTWLEQSLGNSVRRLCVENVALETDPSRGGTSRDVTTLLQWCTDIWRDIYDARYECPM